MKQAWVLLSHDRRGRIAGGVLVVAGLVVSVVALMSRSDVVNQPPSPCWPSITATPNEARAGESLTVSSTGFQCGYLANDGEPVEYWLVLSRATVGAESFRFGPIRPQTTGAFAHVVVLSPTIESGQWSVTVEGHQSYSRPEGCDICTPPDVTPTFSIV